MTAPYEILSTITLSEGTSYIHPPKPTIVAHMDDAATEIMSDYQQRYAQTISPDAPISEATLMMRLFQTHELLVVDKEEKILGLITSEDLLGEKPLEVTNEKKIKRSEILVRMLMSTQTNIPTFDFYELRHAKVGNIVATLNELQQHFAFVTHMNEETKKQEVCGFFSLWEISNAVGEILTSDLTNAHSLAELQHNLP